MYTFSPHRKADEEEVVGADVEEEVVEVDVGTMMMTTSSMVLPQSHLSKAKVAGSLSKIRMQLLSLRRRLSLF